MIASVAGTVLEAREGLVVLQPTGSGFAFEIQVPSSLKATVESNIMLIIHLHFGAEIGYRMFGFATLRHRQVFRDLLGLPRIGPSIALAALSLPLPELARAITQKDSRALAAVKGIGRKTAEQIILGLEGKLDDLTSAAPPKPAAPVEPPAPEGEADVISALQNMGFKQIEARARARKVRLVLESQGLEAAVREALQKSP